MARSTFLTYNINFMSIRCFIAIELEEWLRKEIALLQDKLRRKLSIEDKSCKWVRPENIHLTLKFLGEVEDTLIAEICSGVVEAVQDFEPFEFEVADCGYFPPRGAARVLWIGVKEGQQELEKLQAEVDRSMEKLGFAPENRKFSAHLTLARIKNMQTGRKVSERVESLEPVSLGRQNVGEVTVFQSELTGKGPIYTALNRGKLKK